MKAMCVNAEDVSLLVITAYRIHINQSTVDVLNSLKLGYKIQVRGLTELKVKLIKKNKKNEDTQCTSSSTDMVIIANEC